MKVKQLLNKEQKHLLLTLRTINPGYEEELCENFSLKQLHILQNTHWHIFALPAHDNINDHVNIQKMQTVIIAAIAHKKGTKNALKHRRHARKLVRSVKHHYIEPAPTLAEAQQEMTYRNERFEKLIASNINQLKQNENFAQAA